MLAVKCLNTGHNDLLVDIDSREITKNKQSNHRYITGINEVIPKATRITPKEHCSTGGERFIRVERN